MPERWYWLLLLLPVLQDLHGQQPYQPAATYWGANHYIEYVAGDAPLVVSAPHDGLLQPSSIPNRTYGTTVRDTNASLAARALVDGFANLTGRRPHLIVCHLHRTKLDANREIIEAAQGDPFAEQAWRDYHQFIDDAKAAASALYGRALYVDVHGHGHPLSLIEIGYLLSASQLGLSNTILNQTTYRNASSIRAIATAVPVAFSEILRGASSLGGYLAIRGHASVPEPGLPGPGGNPYFSGGYNTRRHGSVAGGSVDGVQFELPWAERSSTSARLAFGNDAAWAAREFLAIHYGIDLRTPATLRIDVLDRYFGERGDPGRVRITRSGNTTLPISAALRISGSATAGSDYRALPLSVPMAAGQATAELQIDPLDDAIAEGMETLTMELTGGAAVGQPARATLVLLDDEADPTLAARWSMDRVAGVPGLGTSLLDDTGAGHNGQLLPPGAAGPRATTGRHGEGLGFDESDDHVLVSDFDYPGSDDDFSVAFWFQSPPAAAQSSFQYALAHGGSSVPESINVYFIEQTGTLRSNLRYANNLASIDDLDAGSYQDGQWHHYLLSADADGLAQVFVDGACRAAVRFGGDRFDPAGNLVLGGRDDLSAMRFYGGLLDDVRIHDRALSAAEARALFEAQPTWWRAFGAGCPHTTGVAQLSLFGVPAVGFAPQVRLQQAPPGAPVLFALGGSNASWNALPLPLSMAFLGGPGCELLVGPLATLPGQADPGGSANAALPLPANPGLLGAALFAQAWVVDPGANPLGLAVSNALQLTIGGAL